MCLCRSISITLVKTMSIGLYYVCTECLRSYPCKQAGDRPLYYIPGYIYLKTHFIYSFTDSYIMYSIYKKYILKRYTTKITLVGLFKFTLIFSHHIAFILLMFSSAICMTDPNKIYNAMDCILNYIETF